mmetsp:Transcript_70453/g.86449  ORF Transcript_70453/g.86449 Transcript_70453/m.86449 type:complete len:223 (+) Transcript_70453:67-735(+)
MPEIKEHESESKNESENVNASNKAIVQFHPGFIMQQCKEIAKNSRNSWFRFGLYSQETSELEMYYTYADFQAIKINDVFHDLKGSSGIKFLVSIQKRMEATKDAKNINIKERHTVEYANGESGISSGISVIMVHTENGYIYIRYGGINKNETMKAKWLAKAGGYTFAVIAVGLAGYIAANWWKKNRENAAREHELEIAKAQKPIQNFIIEKVVTKKDECIIL